MKILRPADPDYAARLRELTAPSSLFDPAIEESARGIVDAVKARGDDALLEFTRRFDGANLSADRLKVTQAELLAASLKADEPLRSAVKIAARNIESFSRKSLRKNWSGRNSQGARVGEKFDPFQRVGIYIPGGLAPLISTALMTIVPARVAGCPEIVVCTPCNAAGEVNAALLFAARSAGATEIHRVGGAQAIAAMAHGTASIPRVQKIFGPGNAYVVAAMRLLFGHAAFALLPGPSEILVLADDTADPGFVAADMLAQGEHGPRHHRLWLLTTSARLLKSVEKEINRQLPSLRHRSVIQTNLDENAWLIQVRAMPEAIRICNQLAPEHCEIMARGAKKIAGEIVTAGAIFLGPWSPTALGDYVAGPSHVLPTGGAGASFAGLTVDQFQRRTSMVEFNRAALKKSLPALTTFADAEGLDAHRKSVAIRCKPAN